MSPMAHQSSPQPITPCIIDQGIVVNKNDIQRLLGDLTYVQYVHSINGCVYSQGQGCVVEVFNEPISSTIVANHGLYINLQSFDYLQLGQSTNGKAYFDLIQGDRQLRLIPLNNPLQEQLYPQINTEEIEAIFNQVLATKWDCQLDDEGEFPI
jgi:hypothetical protein